MSDPATSEAVEPDAEDAKLVVLARAAMGRTGGGTGAAVRDTDGRTYAAGAVELTALPLTALQAAVAAAISSGAEGFEAAVLVGGAAGNREGAQPGGGDAGIAAVYEVSPAAPIILADRAGTVLATLAGAGTESGVAE